MRRTIAFLSVVVLASCSHGGSTLLPAAGPNGEANQWQQVPAGSYASLYSFAGGKDGGYPYAGLTVIDGALYGTTYGGGGSQGWGTVFRMNAAGVEHVLYRFKAGNDGAHPYAGLIPLNGTLYGTTQQGGTSGNGTVFKISTLGAERVVYSFKGGSDGQYPYGRLIAFKGMLYGTTFQGGVSSGWGTVFAVTPGGKERVLYRFKAGNDGAHPYAGLTIVNADLYGTTYQGGTKGWGTVFKVTTSGHEQVVYSFKSGRDGAYPAGRLITFHGALFGTTYQGGVSPGWGTVFKVSPTGIEDVLYRFKAGNDGAHPVYAGLIAIGDTLYGTTYQGGSAGLGTVYKVSTSGVEGVLYSFAGDTDGAYPYDGLAELDGGLYGTTFEGGASDVGTVFKLVP